MSKLTEQSGRRMRLSAIVDREKNCVQIIRNLNDTRGFLVDSGNMGWMTIEDFEAFVSETKRQMIAAGPGALFFQLTGVDPAPYQQANAAEPIINHKS